MLAYEFDIKRFRLIRSSRFVVQVGAKALPVRISHRCSIIDVRIQNSNQWIFKHHTTRNIVTDPLVDIVPDPLVGFMKSVLMVNQDELAQHGCKDRAFDICERGKARQFVNSQCYCISWMIVLWHTRMMWLPRIRTFVMRSVHYGVATVVIVICFCHGLGKEGENFWC